MDSYKKLEERLSSLQMLDRQDLATIFNITSEQVTQLVKRGVIPPPVCIGGYLKRWPLHWIIGVLENLQQQQQQAANDKETEV